MINFILKLIGMQLSTDFSSAIFDYYSLLQKKYPQKSILKIVGDRYRLSRDERNMLYRGVSVASENIFRKDKIVNELPTGSTLIVDGLNQILTVSSYLNGNAVFISTDGILRDASEMHGKIFRTDLLDRSISLIFNFIQPLKLRQLIFYIDQQMSHHQKIKEMLSGRISESQIIISDQVDKSLANIASGIIGTSDSQIIKKTKLKIFDLSLQTLKFHFKPNFLDLHHLLYKNL